MIVRPCVAAACVVSFLLACGAAPAQPASAGPAVLQALGQLRVRDCPNPTTSPLRAVAQLDDAARRIAEGAPSDQALRAAGYRAVRTFQVNLGGHGSVAAVAQTLQRNYCAAMVDPQLTDVGVHQRGSAWWIVMAAPFAPPPASASADVAARVLALTNQARAQPRRCGGQSFAAAPALQPNPLLDRAAAAHSQEMARFSFMAHEGRDGSEPADRISRAGYRWRSIGENVAAGQTTADEVVRDWLRSPGHCANLMNAKFTEMGLAFAVNPASEGGMYWTQTFGRPR